MLTDYTKFHVINNVLLAAEDSVFRYEKRKAHGSFISVGLEEEK